MERNFADRQRQRAGPAANTPSAYGGQHPVDYSQPYYATGPPVPLGGPYAQAPSFNARPAPAFDPLTGEPLNGGPTAFNALPPGALSAGETPTIHGNGQIARKAGELLIISYDLGTTACKWITNSDQACSGHDENTIAAGCAYHYRQADGQIGIHPEIVDEWPGQAGSSIAKTPSVLVYNQAFVRPRGFRLRSCHG